MGLIVIALDFGGIYFIISGMRSDKPDPYDLVTVINTYNKSVMIAFNIKNDATVSNNAGGWI